MAQAIKWVSANSVIAKIYRDNNFNENLNSSSIIEWIMEGLERLDVLPQYENKKVELEIHNHRAEAPCDIIHIKQIKYHNAALTHTNNTGSSHFEEDNPILGNGFNYSFNWPYIKTNFSSGSITVYYVGFKVDEDTGLPLIPDNVYVREALSMLVLSKLKQSQYVSQQISFNEWQAIKQEADLAIDNARTKFTFISPEEFVGVTNMWTTLIPNRFAHDSFFTDNTTPQSLE